MSEKRKIDSLQTLRAVAFIGIFLNHAGSNIQWAAWGVSVFFTLSGFLMYYQYEDKELECSVKNNMSFSLNKIKKLYPLHIITMICAALLYIVVNIAHGWSLRQADIKANTLDVAVYDVTKLICISCRLNYGIILILSICKPKSSCGFDDINNLLLVCFKKS